MERLGPTDKPAPYLVADRKEWIVSEDAECAGFAILVRTSISNAEQQWLRDQHRDIAGRYQDEWNALPGEERDVALSPRAKQDELLAPYVYDWNAQGFLRDGTQGEIPPPAIAGPQAFACIGSAERQFIVGVILDGYIYLGKATDFSKLSKPSGDTAETQTPPETQRPSSRSRRRTSSTRSASTSAGSDPMSTSP